MIRLESLRQRCELQEVELLQSTKKAQEAMTLVIEESAKSKAAREIIKSLAAQDRLDKTDIRLSKSAVPSNVDLIKQLDSKASKQGKKSETFSLVRSSHTPSLLQLKDVILSTAVDLRQTVPKPVLTSSGVSSRSVSPFSRRPSPPRSATPIPTTSGLSFSKSIWNCLKKRNELLNQEVLKLRAQV